LLTVAQLRKEHRDERGALFVRARKRSHFVNRLVRVEGTNRLALIQNWRIALDPAPDRDAVNGEVPPGFDLLEIASVSEYRRGQRMHKRDHIFEMPPAEQCQPSFGSRSAFPDPLSSPHLQYIEHQ